MINKASNYIKKNQKRVNKEYRHQYHLMAPIGWMNDPNGFSMYNGEYHLFYQYHPYASKWGPMYWGHAISTDLVDWKDFDVALAPDQNCDIDGCFSGSAIEKDGEHYLFYTGNVNSNSDDVSEDKQVQCLAIGDGSSYHKYEKNPIIAEESLPSHAVKSHFRDPKVWLREGIYYMLIGSLNVDGSGQALLYKSTDLKQWDYMSVLAKSNNKFGKMWECPDLFELDNEDVLVVSTQFLDKEGDRYCNIHSSIYMTGRMDYEKGEFIYHSVDEIDYGFDFYAPQTILDSKGRRLMIAWMQTWDRYYLPHEKGHLWNGAMTIPRELSVIDGKLYQLPIEEIKKYRFNHVQIHSILMGSKNFKEIKGRSIELNVEVDINDANTFGIKLFMNKEQTEKTLISYDVRRQKLVFDRSQSGEILSKAKEEEGVNEVRQTRVILDNQKLKLHLFLDESSIEIFINDGIRTMTSNIYSNINNQDIQFYADKEVYVKLNKWDLIINRKDV